MVTMGLEDEDMVETVSMCSEQSTAQMFDDNIEMFDQMLLQEQDKQHKEALINQKIQADLEQTKIHNPVVN
jgi:hypothetical protein